MGQKIVITANMKPPRKTQQKVVYQWHWRRIFVAALAVMASMAALGYVLSETPQSAPASRLTPGNAEQIVEVAASETPVANASVPSEQQTDEAVSVEAPVVVEQPIVLAEEGDTQDDTMPEAAVAEIVVAAEPEPPQPEQTEQVEAIQPPEPRAEFAESAVVASLAEGAKIDIAKVSRSVLTTNVVEREPVDALQIEIPRHTFHDKLYFFTEINGLQGQNVRHLWYFQNQLMADVQLGVHTPRYRTFSSKNIMLNQVGLWRVEVRDAQNHLLATKEFRIVRRD